MSAALRDFVSKAVGHKRIRFGDLRRLKRDILPARITSREQAEVLLALDSSVDRADREWRRYLIASIRDFAIWGSPPGGRIDEDKAEWLVAALRTSSRKTAGPITREIVREAPEIDDEALQVLSVNPRRGRRNRGRGGPAPGKLTASYEDFEREEPLPSGAPLSPSICLAPPRSPERDPP
jgi:hypothetical protein